MKDEKELKTATSPAPLARAYRMKAKVRDLYPNATTLINLEPVALNGTGYKVEVKGNSKTPPGVKEVRGATQAELKALYAAGHPDIEEFDA